MPSRSLAAARRRGARPLAAALAFAAVSAWAQDAAPPAAPASSPPAPVRNSLLDAPLFYQLLIGEIEARQGQPGTAYQVILDAARRSRDETLFRRAVEIALQARAGEEALTATRAWRGTLPTSQEALRTELQILSALNRLDQAAEPLRALLLLATPAERSGLIAAVPRFLQRAADPAHGARLVEEVLQPYLEQPVTRVAAQVAIGRGWLAAADSDRALALAQQAHADAPTAEAPVLLALELLPTRREAEPIVNDYVVRPDAEPALLLLYARALMTLQRYPDALQQLQTVSRRKPDLAPPYLTLGALYLDLKQPAEGEAALQRYLALTEANADASDDDGADAPDGADEARASSPAQGRVQAWLMLAASADQRGDYAAAERWLAKVDDPQRALEVQARRASMLARQGRVDEARRLLQTAPERGPQDARAKLDAEAAMLREARRWKEAYDVMGQALQREPDDPELLYEQSMMAEKLGRIDEMERLLRRVIELKPDNAHAYNALGYSLADRGKRLGEARDLIARALELAPNDPFITDSLGWVEFRLGNRARALELLRRAYASRPDAEIAAHLGEVLWADGQQDEARRIWAEARRRDGSNEVLAETLKRLKVRQ
ncbi:tetratricopeptide repeat protein [Rubrivivax gelatinosus]|uniref:Flp pilus assembly protein TadD n=1 Tax=Rubrivivax gelatinosus TaxID=28068 RepID=A0A4R2ME91_RUBGE|nr:tetratricopeptide repeat protein [Rubrivivax gelatinosus]TCP05142.1 Flp pilus assembly protein TadD [Rubrivivax gelatinosus]